jgi:DNA-binding NtrC family response regulator
MRLIAASNSSLDALTAQGAFRRDLLYRLKVLHIVIPPLRNRRDDIPVLAQAFLDRLNAAHETRKRFHKDALSTLGDGDYPGNVRELQNLVERAYYSALGGRVIAGLPVDGPRLGNGRVDGPSLLQRLSEGRDDFWKSVYSPYKSREISREQVLALVDVGLRETDGSYKRLAALVGIEPGQYRRFKDFLRRNKCQLDFRPYRRSAGVAEPRGRGAG